MWIRSGEVVYLRGNSGDTAEGHALYVPGRTQPLSGKDATLHAQKKVVSLFLKKDGM